LAPENSPAPFFRETFRDLFAIHPAACSLDVFKRFTEEQRKQCDLIFTFVLGGSNSSRSELVDESFPITIAAPEYNSANSESDLGKEDMTFLNIRYVGCRGDIEFSLRFSIYFATAALWAVIVVKT
jgi:hypothetical protein